MIIMHGKMENDCRGRTLFPHKCTTMAFEMRWVGHVARMEEMRNTYRFLAGKPEEERPLGKSRRRREDNIRMDLGENLGVDRRIILDWILGK
jgi:hypothetical protein